MVNFDWTLIEISANIFTVIGVILAISIAAYTVKNDKKNLQLNGLKLAFEKFNNEKTRKSRLRILQAYSKYLHDNGHKWNFNTVDFHEHYIVNLEEINPKLKEDIIKVKSDFEEIAVMEKNGMINELSYFDAYWGMMLRCFAALHGNIIETRKKTGTEHYTKYFEDQSQRAIHYWRLYHGEDHIIYHHDDNDYRVLDKF